MSKDSPAVVSVPVPEQYDAADRPSPAAHPGTVEPTGPLDWDCVLEVASARLIESSIEHDTIDHMKASGMADDFAAQLCAYGLAAGELVHMHRHVEANESEEARTDKPKAGASTGA
jgi:hypothetical protein